MPLAVPVLRGLVLAGGRSERMQTDKGALHYHGLDQRQHTAALLAEFCPDVRVSVRPDQAAELPAGLTALPDTFLNLGPLGGILSAFQADPNAAWLVLACDLPFLTRDTLELSGDATGSRPAWPRPCAAPGMTFPSRWSPSGSRAATGSCCGF